MELALILYGVSVQKLRLCPFRRPFARFTGWYRQAWTEKALQALSRAPFVKGLLFGSLRS